MATAMSSAELINSMSKNAGKLMTSFQKTVSAFEQLNSVPQAFSESTNAVQQFAVVEQVLTSITTVIEADLLTNLKTMGDLITKQIPAWLSVNWKIATVGATIGIILLFLDQLGISVTDIVNLAGQFFTWLFDVIMQGVAVIIPYVQGLWDVFLSAIPVIGPLFLGLAAALATYYGMLMAVSLYQKALTGIMQAYQFVVNVARMAQVALTSSILMTSIPITLIIALIVGLIVALIAIIAAVQPVRDFVAGAFRSMADFVSKALGWISFSLADLINNFIELANSATTIISGIAKGLGWLLGQKWELDLEIPKINSEKWKSNTESFVKDGMNTIADGIEDFDGKKLLDSLNLDKLTKGKPAELEVNTTPSMPEQPDLGMWNAGTQAMNISTVSEVGRVGQIDNPVDVSSEDLKTMRELAEMKNIQNFVSMTPTVSVQTGDIRSGYDVDTIISRITTSLEEQIVSSAKGVYA
jgi:hypothetical protein